MEKNTLYAIIAGAVLLLAGFFIGRASHGGFERMPMFGHPMPMAAYGCPMMVNGGCGCGGMAANAGKDAMKPLPAPMPGCNCPNVPAPAPQDRPRHHMRRGMPALQPEPQMK